MRTGGLTRSHASITGVVLLVVALGYGWWFTSLAPFSGAGLPAVLVVGVALTVGARRRAAAPDGAGRSAPVARRPIGAWVAVVAGIVAWELFELFQHPRSDHPTVSSITDPLQQWHGVRLLFFAAWLALGWALAS